MFTLEKFKEGNLSILFGFFSFFSFFLYFYKYFEIDGYIVFSSVIFIFIFFLERVLVKKSLIFFNKIDLLVFIFFIYCFFWVNINLFFYNKVGDFYIYSLQSLLFMLIMYFLGRSFEKGKGVKKFFSLLFFLNLIFFIINIDLNLASLSFINEHSGEVSVTYQAIARCYLVIGCFYLILLKSNLNKFIVGLLTILILFFIGSRSDFFAYFIFIISYIVFFFDIKYKLITLFFAIFCMSLLQLGGWEFSEYRVFSILEGFAGSSWDSRKNFESYTLGIIKSSPLFGGIYEQYLYYGMVGSYSHNILSAWQAYGLLGFLILIFLVVFPVLSIFYKILFFRARINEYDRFVVCFGMSSIFLLLISKPHYWAIFFLYIGVFSKGLENENNSFNISSSKK